MSDKQHIGRRVKNTLDRPFHVVFFERVYPGAPRWWSGEWEKHHRTPSGGNGYCLEREREVKKHLELSHNEKCLFNHEVPYLLACTNFSCTLRAWSIVNFLAGTLAYVESEKDFAIDDKFEAAERIDFSKRIKADLHRVSLGKDVPVGKNQHMEKCPRCQRPKMVSGITPIRKKWVYVLHGSDGPLKPHTEIYLETPAQGDMYQDFRNGAFNPRRKQQYPGYFPIDKIDGEVWQFFLSPVRLGPKAISMLSQSRRTDGDWADSVLEAIDKEDTVIETGWDPTQQPWCTVVSRKFSPGQVKTPCEPVALVDPFSWVGQASDLDYLSIAAARQALLDNPDEQARAFIAASLAPAKGEKQDEHQIEQTEPWDLKGQTVEVPPEYASSGNIAQAWVDRYKQALEYLEKETRFACSRVIFAVRFSQAHRVVELACQENTGDPGALAFGMIHWNHILREMLVCEPGKSFVAWLTKSRGAIDRIPQQTVSEKYKSDPRAKEIGPGLPAMILSYMTPLLLRESENFAEDFRRRLAEIEIEVPMDWATAILAPETVKPIADIAFSIPEKYLHHYIEHFPEELHVEQFHAFSGAQSWKARIMGLSKLKDLLRVAALLRCVFEFGEEYKGPDTGWGHFGHVVEKIETPVKVAEFGIEQAKLLIEAGYGEELEEVAEHIARHGAKGIYGEPLRRIS